MNTVSEQIVFQLAINDNTFMKYQQKKRGGGAKEKIASDRNKEGKLNNIKQNNFLKK